MEDAMNRVEPNTVEEALAAWDRGDEVQTVSMGGMGEGYEMAIQCVGFELMRALLADEKMLAMVRDTPDGAKYQPELVDGLDSIIHSLDAKDPETGRYKLGGLSGAQAGAAKSMALQFVRNGWDNARDQVPERMIFVRKQDPMALYEKDKVA